MEGMLRAGSQVAEQPLSAAVDAMKRIGAAEWWVTAGGDARRFSEHAARSLELWLKEKQANKLNVHFVPPTIEGAHWYIVARLPRKSRPADCSPPPHFVIIADDYMLLWRLIEPVTTAQATAIARRLVYRLGGRSAVGEPAPMPGTVFARNPRDPSNGVRVTMMPKARVPGYLADGDKLTLPSAKNENAASPFTDADTVKAKPIEWLWPNLVPCGCLTLLGGAPGMGKSQAAISMAAIVSKGAEWPGGTRGERGSALVLESEDDLERVITPRLIAAGADLRRVGLSSRIDLSAGVSMLEAERKRRKDLRLVVLSPVREFFGEAVEARGNLAVREAMKPLLTWAGVNSIAVVGIAHPPKGKEDKEAFAGSNAFLEVARAAYSVIPDPESEEPIMKRKPRLLVSAKSNLSADDVRMSYRIDGADVGGIQTSKVVWGDG